MILYPQKIEERHLTQKMPMTRGMFRNYTNEAFLEGYLTAALTPEEYANLSKYQRDIMRQEAADKRKRAFWEVARKS